MLGVLYFNFNDRIEKDFVLISMIGVIEIKTFS